MKEIGSMKHMVMIPLILLNVDGRYGAQYILLDHGCRGRVKLEGKNDAFLQCHTVLKKWGGSRDFLFSFLE